MAAQTFSVKSLPRFTSPFPPLRLSENDRNALLDATNLFLDEGLEDFEQFTIDHPSRHLSEDDWQVVAEHRDVRAYVPRIREDPAQPQTVILAGTVNGSPSDCIYGLSAPTIDHERIKSGYTKDRMCNSALIYTFDEPTADEPYRCMKIRWYVTEMLGFFKRLVMIPRDTTYVEASGVTAFSTGEQVPYMLFHTIDLPQLGPVKEYKRIECSSVTFWRPLGTDRAEVFSKIYATLHEPARVTWFATRNLARALVASIPDTAEVGRLKKLMWFMRRHAQRRQLHTADAEAQQHLTVSSKCFSCGKSTRTLVSTTRLQCTLCMANVCSTCSIKKRLYGISSRNSLCKYRVRVCKPCWQSVLLADTDRIARDEVLDRHAVSTEQALRVLPVQYATRSENATDWSSSSGVSPTTLAARKLIGRAHTSSISSSSIQETVE